MEGFLRFLLHIFNGIILGVLGSWIRHYIFNVPYTKGSKKKSDDWYGDVIDVEEYKNRLVGFGAVIIVVCLLLLFF